MSESVKKGFQKYREEPLWYRQQREEWYGKYMSMEWPQAMSEEWRRTPPELLEPDTFKPSGKSLLHPPSKITADEKSFFSAVLKFSGEHFAYFGPAEELKEQGVIFMPLELAVRDPYYGALIKKHLETRESGDRFEMWRRFASLRGYFIHIPPHVKVRDPFYVEFKENGHHEGFHYSGIVMVQEGGEASVVEVLKEGGNKGVLLNGGADLFIGKEAKLDFTSLQALNKESRFNSYSRVEVDKEGVFNSFYGGLGAGVSRVKLESFLKGDRSRALVKGIYFTEEGQHMDILTTHHHSGKNTAGNTIFKGCLSRKSRTVYQGLIDIEKSGEGTDAYLSNKNILLGDGARGDSIPKLIIKNSNVKCSHGSTTGKPDPAQLFYLESRGFSPEEALKMLIRGFFDQITEDRTPFVKELLGNWIEAKIDLIDKEKK